jgi:hypothetical protein
MNNNAVIEFDVKLPKLSKNENQVLKLLVEAARLVGPLYLQQEKDAKNSLSHKDLEKASEKDPEVLSPYTVIEKKNGKVITTPYHIKYASFLKPISEKLNEAANLTENKEFGKALKIQSDALLEGSYEKAIATWLKLKPYVIDISIGPFEHLDPELFFDKASYQAWAGVIYKAGTERLNNYKEVIFSARREALMPSEHIDHSKHIKAKTIDVLIFSGLMARTKFVGVNLPMTPYLAGKYGSEITIFNQPNDFRMKNQILPTFRKIFSKGFQEGFTDEDLRRGSLRYIAIHQLAHSYLYYKNAVKSLQEYYHVIYELSATLLGLRMAGSLLLKDRINNKQLESMMIAYISRCFYQINNDKSAKSMINYTQGSAIAINFMFESGALKRNGDIIVPNFMKMFVSLHDLSNLLERILSSGTQKDAEKFVKKYS